MPNATFNRQVLSAFGQTPSNLAWSLSATSPNASLSNAGFVALSTVGSGLLNSTTLSSKVVRGIAFNTITSTLSATGTLVSLSASPGTTFRVDSIYNNAPMALIYTDATSTLFTCFTGTTVQATASASNGYDTTTPEVRRHTVLGYR